MDKFHNHGSKTERLVKIMPSSNEAAKACELFSLMNDGTRLRILWLLSHTEDCVTNIALSVDMSTPAVSHHLRFLKQAGILDYRKDGKETYYRLADNEKAKLVHKMVDDVFLMECPK